MPIYVKPMNSLFREKTTYGTAVKLSIDRSSYFFSKWSSMSAI